MSLLDALFNRPKNLTNTQREFWDTNGYLILKRCIKPAVIDRYQRELDGLWENRASDDNPLVIDFWEGPLSGKRMFFKDAPDDSRKYIHKLNDLHFESQACRDLCLNPTLQMLLIHCWAGHP